MIDLNNPAIRQALQDIEIIQTDKVWARLEIRAFAGQPKIKIAYGVIHSNGIEECALGYREYWMEGDKVFVHNTVHNG